MRMLQARLAVGPAELCLYWFKVSSLVGPERQSRAAWVLTGGASSRMGTDKALLEVEGRRLVERVIGAAAAVARVSLVGDPTKYAEFGLPVIPDNFPPGTGPLAGIEAALRRTGAEWNLVVACDMPLVNANVLEALFDAAEGGDGAMPPREPLCAVYHRRCHGAVLRAIESGKRKVTDAFAGLAIRYLPVDNAVPFTNLNTPDEVRRFLEWQRAGGRNG